MVPPVPVSVSIARTRDFALIRQPRYRREYRMALANAALTGIVIAESSAIILLLIRIARVGGWS